MHVEQVRFRSGQVRSAADLYLPDGIADRAPAPAVVMGHSVVMVKEALGPHAEHLARAGFVVLAVDWRTVGSSEGEPRCQWLPFWQVEDLRSGVSYLRTRPEVDPERIGLWGHSTAAGVAVVAGALDRRVKCVAGQNPSLLDAWTALEKTRGRRQFGAVRDLLQQDFERRFETGEGATVPALAADDPKLAGYIAQSEELFPTFRNQLTLASMEQVLLWAPLHLIHRLPGPAHPGRAGRHLRAHPREDDMKVLLAGATGAIGVPITRRLLAHGHQVLGLTRDPAVASGLEALGVTPVVADALDRDRLLRAVDGHAADAVIHELTACASPRSATTAWP